MLIGGGGNKAQAVTLISAGHSARISTQQAAKRFAKPETYTGSRTLYDIGTAKHHAKAGLFSETSTVRDPYTGDTLTLTKAEAKARFGDDWQRHLAEADHITPLERIHEAHKSDAWVTNEDIRKAANSPDNMEVISRKINNAKRSRTNEEFINDREYRDSKGVKLSEDAERKAVERGIQSERSVERKLNAAKVKNIASTFHSAGMSAAKSAGTSALAMSGIINITAVIKGEKSAGDAVTDIIKDGGTGALTGYVTGGGLTTLAHSLSNSSSEIIKSLAKSNVPAQIISTVTVIGSSLKRYASGEINTREFLLEIGDKGMNFGAMSYGFAVGQSLIPLPVIGGVIGSLVGSALTGGLIRNIQEALQRKELEHQERMRLIAECEEAVRQEKAFRAELEERLSQYFREYKTFFYDAISGMQEAFISGDADRVIAGTNAITRKLGGSVQYETVDEYRRLLSSGAAFSW